MLEEGYKFEKLLFLCCQVENKVTSMYKISWLHLYRCFLEFMWLLPPCLFLHFKAILLNLLFLLLVLP
jgi:hypothetical protein